MCLLGCLREVFKRLFLCLRGNVCRCGLSFLFFRPFFVYVLKLPNFLYASSIVLNIKINLFGTAAQLKFNFFIFIITYFYVPTLIQELRGQIHRQFKINTLK